MGGRILVVDDCVELVTFFQSVLAPLGHEVVAAYDGEDALRKFHDELPDLVLLDLLLPKRDGFEVCAEIKRTTHGLITPVAFMTGVYRNQSKIDMMRTHGVVDYLTKPVPVSKITALVDWALAGKSEGDASPAEDAALEGVAPEGEDPETLTPGTFLRLFRRAEEEGRSGLLVARRGSLVKALVLEEGRVVGARSNLPADRMDRVLLAMRKVTPAQAESLRHEGDGDAEVLEAAVAAGFLDEVGRAAAVRFQAVAVALSLFKWTAGTGFLAPPRPLEFNRLELPAEVWRLTAVALRRNAELREHLGQQLIRPRDVLVRSWQGDVRDRASELARREREVLDLIDGTRTVREIRQVGLMAELPVEDALAVLVGAGIVASPRDASLEDERDEFLRASGTHRAGSLENVPFAELLGALSREEATGALTVEGPCRRLFSLRSGEVTYARSSDPRDALGQALLECGMIDEEQLEAALVEQREHRPDRQLGALLVDHGVLSLATLDQGLRAQLLRIVETTFAWREGDFVFEPASQGSGPAVALGRDRLELLRAGIRQMGSTALSARFRGRSLTLAASAREADGRLLGDEEQELLGELQEATAPVLLGRDAPLSRLRSGELLLATGLAELGPADTQEEMQRGAFQTQALPGAARALAPPEHEPAPVPESHAEVTLLLDESDLEEPAQRARAAGLPAAIDVLAFLRDEVLAERRSTERELRAACEEIGRLRERLRVVEEENCCLRATHGLPPAAEVAAREPLASVLVASVDEAGGRGARSAIDIPAGSAPDEPASRDEAASPAAPGGPAASEADPDRTERLDGASGGAACEDGAEGRVPETPAPASDPNPLDGTLPADGGRGGRRSRRKRSRGHPVRELEPVGSH